MRSPENYKKIATPLAAAIGGAAVGSFLRGMKARRRGKATVKMIEAAHKRTQATETENKRLKHEVNHDDLTGLLTKKALVKSGNERLAKARPDQVFVLAVLDVDNFKAINDKHPESYDEGDRVLKSVAKVLNHNVRQENGSADLLARGNRDDEGAARLGGDEFAGLFEITPRNEKGARMSVIERAKVFCNRIRYGVQSEFEGRADIDEVGGVDVSIGFVVRRPGEMMESMLSRAVTPMKEEKHIHHAENGSYRS